MQTAPPIRKERAVLPMVLAVLAVLAGVGVSLLMLVMLVASAPNSTPEQWGRIRALMISVAAVALAGAIGGVWALFAGRSGLAGGLGLAPAAYSVVLFVVLLAAEA